MSPTSSQQQERMNQAFNSLNGKEKAELLLASVIGKQLSGEWLELIKSAMAEYMVWHNQQHPNFETCEHCEIIKNNMIMYSAIKYWVEVFENTTGKK